MCVCAHMHCLCACGWVCTICVQMCREGAAAWTARQLAGLLTGLCSLLIEGSQRQRSGLCSARPQYCPLCCYSSQSTRRKWELQRQVYSCQIWAKSELNRFQTFRTQHKEHLICRTHASRFLCQTERTLVSFKSDKDFNPHEDSTCL